ncbi:hypothetical protein BGZ94_003510 [Podila epigama]|nr:hypothetical protein BGZ94_003510 [Podila epigama]
MDETFVLVGTPFPQTKRTDDFGEPKRPNPTKDLEVRDEQGRRRFHGAFTGGFSAGYYNTVGSKEGWAPSEFVSSRDKRWNKKVSRPEDFMDEEDKEMLKDSARLVTTDDFDTLGSTRKEVERKRAAARNMQSSGGALGVLPDNIIDDLVVPSSEPVGIKLLKRMGWKPGQGIGPRVTKKQRKVQGSTFSDEGEDDTPTGVTFAPIDSAIIVFTNKTNSHGLGFDPYKNAPEFDTRLQSQAGSKYLSNIEEASSGLGFGRFDDDDDDDDIYRTEPVSLHDFDLDISGPPSGSVNRGKEGEQGRPKSKPIKWFSPPTIPDDFVPHHVFHDDIRIQPPSSKGPQPKLTADDRALVLGETPIDAPRRSVFEYISAENKNRLDNIFGMVLDTEGDKRLKKDAWEVPKIEKASAEAALKGFMPFGDNLAKQNRYKQYLNIQAGLSNETITLVEGFSGQDMNKELNEFVQAARIFKPLSSTMSNRFTSASKVIEFAQPAAGLRSAADIKASAADKSSPMHTVVERMEVPKSQAAKAAAMGMFGPLTRTIVDFYPSKLLCKRFNVPNPHPDHKEIAPEGAKDLLDKTTMDAMMLNRRPDEDILRGEAGQSTAGTPPIQEPEAAAVTAEVEEKAEEAVQERPSMDIFKAIFDESDSDSESDGEEESKENTHEVDKTPVSSTVTYDQPMEEPLKPVFTRRSERGQDVRPSSRKDPSRKKIDVSDLKLEDEEDEEEFGPKLSMRQPTLERKTKSSSKSLGASSKASLTSTFTGGPDVEYRKQDPIDISERAVTMSNSVETDDSLPRKRIEPDSENETLTARENDVEGGRGHLQSEKTSRRSLSPEYGSQNEPSKKHKSSRHSSSMKRDSDRHRSSHSSHRHRSRSRSRGRDGDRERSKRSKESRHHREDHGRRASRSRSPKRSSRDKDHDSRHRHSKSSKRSRSDRDDDTATSRSSTSRHSDSRHDSYLDDDDLWVEKKVEIPASPKAPTAPTAPHRPRASQYF